MWLLSRVALGVVQYPRILVSGLGRVVLVRGLSDTRQRARGGRQDHNQRYPFHTRIAYLVRRASRSELRWDGKGGSHRDALSPPISPPNWTRTRNPKGEP